MTDIYNKKFTIYNDIPDDGVNERQFNRYVIDKCMSYGGTSEVSSGGTIQNIVNAQTVITKDVEHYKPFIEYLKLPADKKANFFTVKVNDFIVLAEVYDIVTNATEFKELKNKYKNNGISITTVNSFIYGLPTDNISMTNA